MARKKNIKTILKKIKENPTDPSNMQQLESIMSNPARMKVMRKSKKLSGTFQSAYQQQIAAIANDLTAVSRQLFLGLENFTNVKGGVDADPSWQRVVSASNNLTLQVCGDILGSESVDARTLAMQKWVNVMATCFDKGDFHTAMMIYSALRNQSIDRLQSTKAGLTQDSLMLLEKFGALVRNNQSFIDFMQKSQQAKLSEPIIPYVGAYRGQIDYAKGPTGMPVKRRLARELLRMQVANEKLHPAASNIDRWVIKDPEQKTREDELYQLSQQRESRGSTAVASMVFQKANHLVMGVMGRVSDAMSAVDSSIVAAPVKQKVADNSILAGSTSAPSVAPGKALPRLSNKVDIAHLNENGRLFTEQQFSEIEKAFKANVNLHRLKFPLLHATADSSFKQATVERFINPETGEVRYFAVYQGKEHDKHLGEGAIGKVKLIQDLKTGEWLAQKIIDLHGDRDRRITANVEMQNLVRANASPGGFERKTIDKKTGEEKTQYIIGMDLAVGVDVSEKYIAKTMDVSRLVIIAAGMAKALSALHEFGLVHRDLKSEQFIFDAKSNRTTLIDLGSAVQMDTAITKVAKGMNPAALPPEIIKLVNVNCLAKARKQAFAEFGVADRKELKPEDVKRYDATVNQYKLQFAKEIEHAKFQCTAQLDVYALGLSIGLVLKLTKDTTASVHFHLSDKEFMSQKIVAIMNAAEADNSHCPIKDKTERDALVSFLKRMTTQDPNQRPSMAEVTAFFNTLEKKLAPAFPAAQQHVLLDLNYYAALTADERKLLISQLSSVTQVWFVENDALSPKTKMVLQRELEHAGLAVGERYFNLKEAPLDKIQQDLAGHVCIEKEKCAIINASHPALVIERQDGMAAVPKQALQQDRQPLVAPVSMVMPRLPAVPKGMPPLPAVPTTLPPLPTETKAPSLKEQSIKDLERKLKDENHRTLPANKKQEPMMPLIKAGHHRLKGS